MKSSPILIAVTATTLVACAQTRDPTPVGLKQSKDEILTCADLETEFKTNTEISTYKISKNNSDDGRDILLGFFIWPGLADFKNADGIEGNALLDRNIYIRELANQKKCDIRSWPTQPSRYS
jgi:hypothetical protein